MGFYQQFAPLLEWSDVAALASKIRANGAEMRAIQRFRSVHMNKVAGAQAINCRMQLVFPSVPGMWRLLPGREQASSSAIDGLSA